MALHEHSWSRYPLVTHTLSQSTSARACSLSLLFLATRARPHTLPASCASTSAGAPATPARHIAPPFHHRTSTSVRPTITHQGRAPVPWLLLPHVRCARARALHSSARPALARQADERPSPGVSHLMSTARALVLPIANSLHTSTSAPACRSPPPTPMTHECECSLPRSPPFRYHTTTSARPAIAHRGRAPAPCFLPPHVHCTIARAPTLLIPHWSVLTPVPSRFHSLSARHTRHPFHCHTTTSARPAIAR